MSTECRSSTSRCVYDGSQIAKAELKRIEAPTSDESSLLTMGTVPVGGVLGK
jgi:hypothetical protein